MQIDLDAVANGENRTELVDDAALVPTQARITMLLVVVIPFVGLITGMVLFWDYGFSWTQLGIFLGMYFLTALGVTVGYHRLFTHQAFEAVWPVKLVLALLGSMAVQGPLFKWVATHRLHHKRSDTPEDPHSPNVHGSGVWAALRGFWHAHLGWMFGQDSPGLTAHIRDLLKDRLLRVMSRWFVLWVIAGLLIPAVLGGLLTWSWSGALVGFIWGGLIRVFLVHHITFSINSVCHLWGRRPFRTQDRSRNNVVFGFMGLGEGWHNNHHAFPTSARHGLQWWQLDISYMVIRVLEAMRLVRAVRVPNAAIIANRLPQMTT